MGSRLQSALFLAFLALNPVNAVGQEAGTLVLRGRVTDQDAQPVPGARVTLVGASETVAVTGADGQYQIRAPGGAVRLRVSAIGFVPTDAEVTVSAVSGFFNVALQRTRYELPAISVTGDAPAELAGVPGALKVVGTTAIHTRAPVSVMDALRTVPGVAITDEDPYGLNLNVGFRGLIPRRSSRTMLMEDGMPILLGPYGDPSMHYAPPREAMERIEIIKGSSQIANGPQTVAGVVNFVTHNPQTEGTTGEITAGLGDLAYRNIQVRVGTGRNGHGVLLDYVHRAGHGVRLEQGHAFHNAMLKGLLKLSPAQSLLLKSSVWNEASRISETGLTQEEFENDPYSLPFTANGRFYVRRYMGQAIHEARFGASRLRTNAYISNVNRASWRQSGESEERLGEPDYEQDFNCAPGATSYTQCGNQGRPREYTVMGLEPRLMMEFGPGDAPSSVEVGARALRENVRRRQVVGNTPTSREDDAALVLDNEILTTAFSGFVQTRLRTGPVVLSPGVRVENVSQDNNNLFPGQEASGSQAYTQLLPGAGLAYTPSPEITVFFGVHRGFAPPRPSDIYAPEPGQSLLLVDPETTLDLEAGIRLAPRPGVSFEATAFRMTFGNEVIEAPAAAGTRFTNGGRTTHQGVEMGGQLSVLSLMAPNALDDITLGASYTFLPLARFDEDDERGPDIAGNRLPYAPRHLFSGSITLGLRSGISLGVSQEHTGEQFADEENTVDPDEEGQAGILQPYSVTNAFASYTVPRGRVQFRLSVRNAFDKVYVTQKFEGIYTGVRRMIRGEVQWKF